MYSLKIILVFLIACNSNNGNLVVFDSYTRRKINIRRNIMIYRTRTYIAADWTADRDAVDQLMKWNKNLYWGLSFGDAHELSQCLCDDTNN